LIAVRRGDSDVRQGVTGVARRGRVVNVGGEDDAHVDEPLLIVAEGDAGERETKRGDVASVEDERAQRVELGGGARGERDGASCYQRRVHLCGWREWRDR